MSLPYGFIIIFRKFRIFIVRFWVVFLMLHGDKLRGIIVNLLTMAVAILFLFSFHHCFLATFSLNIFYANQLIGVVRLEVVLKVALHLEALAAVLADKRLVLRMSEHVRLQLEPGAEPLVAEDTGEVGLGSLVAFVLLQRLEREELAATPPTRVLLLRRMALGVVDQVVLVVEGLATHAARELAPFHVAHSLQLVDVAQMPPKILLEKEGFLTDTTGDLKKHF